MASVPLSIATKIVRGVLGFSGGGELQLARWTRQNHLLIKYAMGEGARAYEGRKREGARRTLPHVGADGAAGEGREG